MITEIFKLAAEDSADPVVAGGLAIGGLKAGKVLTTRANKWYMRNVVGDWQQTNPELLGASQKDIDALLDAAKLKDKVVVHPSMALGSGGAFYANPHLASQYMEAPASALSNANGKQRVLWGWLHNDLHDKNLKEKVKQYGAIMARESPDLDTLAHEIGHAKSPQGVFRQSLYGLGHIQAVPLATLSSLGTYKRTIDKLRGKNDDNKGITYAVNAVGTIPPAYVLGEEGRASLNGLKYLKEIGKSAVARKAAAKHLGKAFGTYAVNAGIPMAALNAGAYGVAHLQHQIEKRINHGNKDSK